MINFINGNGWDMNNNFTFLTAEIWWMDILRFYGSQTIRIWYSCPCYSRVSPYARGYLDSSWKASYIQESTPFFPTNPSLKLDDGTFFERLRPLILASVPFIHWQCSNTLTTLSSPSPCQYHWLICDVINTHHWKTLDLQCMQGWKREQKQSAHLKDLKKSQNYLSLNVSPK